MSNSELQTNGSTFVVTPDTVVDTDRWFSNLSTTVSTAYVEVFGLDRDEYIQGQSGNTGIFEGNSHVQELTADGDDARVTGIQFAYDPIVGQYRNQTFGLLNHLQFKASSSIGDVTSISIYASAAPIIFNPSGGNAFDFISGHKTDYVGSATILTATIATPVPSQSTPDAIAEAAEAAIGTTRNLDGCWVMASALAAGTGASLPVLSTLSGGGGQANGEWGVAYDGSVQSNASWVNSLRPGDIVNFVTASGGGHITTVGAGSGQGAMLIDNYFETYSGYVVNAANDGNSNDIRVIQGHNQAGEFTGVDPSSVVVYRLDTPLVIDADTSLVHTASSGDTVDLLSLVSATDSFGGPVTQYQVYNRSANDQFTISGHLSGDHSATRPLTVDSLSGVDLALGSSFIGDSVSVRAFNGKFWGDWTTVNVSPEVKKPSIAVSDVTTGASTLVPMDIINRQAPSYLQWQYINASSDTMAIASTAPNAFIVGGNGTKAISVESGQNVIAGGSGSAYLTGGSGADTFFVNLDHDKSVWDTIVNFHQGDALTIWGWTLGTNKTSVDSWSGADGAQGATIRLMNSSDAVLGSVTFAGLSSTQVSSLQSSVGSQQANTYLYLHNQGV